MRKTLSIAAFFSFVSACSGSDGSCFSASDAALDGDLGGGGGWSGSGSGSGSGANGPGNTGTSSLNGADGAAGAGALDGGMPADAEVAGDAQDEVPQELLGPHTVAEFTANPDPDPTPCKSSLFVPENEYRLFNAEPPDAAYACPPSIVLTEFVALNKGVDQDQGGCVYLAPIGAEVGPFEPTVAVFWSQGPYNSDTFTLIAITRGVRCAYAR